MRAFIASHSPAMMLNTRTSHGPLCFESDVSGAASPLRRAEAQQRAAGRLVLCRGLELDALAPERLERVLQQQELRLRVDGRPLPRRGDPRETDLQPAMLAHDRVIARRADDFAVARSSMTNGSAVPAACAASADSMLLPHLVGRLDADRGVAPQPGIEADAGQRRMMREVHRHEPNVPPHEGDWLNVHG